MMAHAEPCARMLARHAPCNACIRRCFHASRAPRSYQRARTARRVKRVRREHARARARCVRACARELRWQQQQRVQAARMRTVRCRACGASRASRAPSDRAQSDDARRGMQSGQLHGGPAFRRLSRHSRTVRVVARRARRLAAIIPWSGAAARAVHDPRQRKERDAAAKLEAGGAAELRRSEAPAPPLSQPWWTNCNNDSPGGSW